MLLLLIQVLSVLVRADSAPDIEAITASRRGKHAYVFEQLKDLNYVRMKLDSTTKAWQRILADWQDFKETCRADRPGLDLESCTTKLSLILTAATFQATELDLVSLTPNFRQMSKKQIYHDMRMDRWFDGNKRTFADFIKMANDLRDVVGRKAADANFQRTLSRMKEQDARARLEVQCALSPPLQSKKLVAVQLLRREAEMKTDPHLILKADLMARDIRDAVRTLSEKCQSPNEMLSQVDAFLKESPRFLDRVHDLAIRACVKVGQGELSAPCENKDFNPAILYSLHLALQKARP